MADFKFNQFKGTRLTTVILISIGLSLFLWGRYKLNGAEEFTMKAEILCNVSDPEKFTAFTCYTNTTEEVNMVELTVLCTKMDRDLIRPDDFALMLDFSSETQQNVIPALELKPSMARYMGPQDFKGKFNVVDIEPKRLKAVIDTISDRSLPVIVDIKGEPGDGYAVSATNITPSFVTVKGPGELLSKMTGVMTESLSVEGVKKTLDTFCSVVVPEKIETHTRNVRVKLEISHAPKIVAMEKIAVEHFGTPQGNCEATFSPATVDITMEVPVDDIEAFDPKEVKAFVDISNLAPSEYTLPVKVLPVKAGRVKDIEPKEIKVSIVKPVRPAKPEKPPRG
ncbi:hypothetical protein J6U78_09455 [bacterium]|nr:hypothetical protein [bacterium]